MQSVNKRTKCRYSNKQLRRIFDYNKSKIEEANMNKVLHSIMDETIGKMFGGSLFGMLNYDTSINEFMMPTKPQDVFKLSRK